MNRHIRLALLTSLLIILVGLPVEGGEMNAELKIGLNNARILQTRFGTYGYRSHQAIFPEIGGLRISLPPGVADLPQTGIYSYFALVGDCEVIVSYEILTLQRASKVQECEVGLALEIGDGGGQGDICRANKPENRSGFALHTAVQGSAKDEYRFVPGGRKTGRIGLRRTNKELIFLMTDDAAGELKEIERLPFTNKTIRTLRLFADAGGSQTGFDVRIHDIRIRAEEITGGVPNRDTAGISWLWLLVCVPVAGAALFWLSRRIRRIDWTAEDSRRQIKPNYLFPEQP